MNFSCIKCDKVVAKDEKGKILPGSAMLCKKCLEYYKSIDIDEQQYEPDNMFNASDKSVDDLMNMFGMK